MLSLCSMLVRPRIGGESLAELNLSGCAQLVDAAVDWLCAHCPRLAKLGLSLCSSLVSPVVRGPLLCRLDLGHCDKLRGPLIGGRRVSDLSLAGCLKLTDEALQHACAEVRA